MAHSNIVYPGGPLDASREEIRLLTLLPKSAGKETQCTLEVYALKNAPEDAKLPPYEALSYTWGRSSLGETITLCGEGCFPVTDNLAAALRRLRYGRHARKLWIDALCINQQDLAERSTQVSYMRRIYRDSAQTIVWLGELAIPKDGSRAPAASSRTNIEGTLSADLLLRSLPRPYWWTRVWVMQEFALSLSEPIVYAGHHQFTWLELHDMFSGAPLEDVKMLQTWDFMLAQVNLNGMQLLRRHLKREGEADLVLAIFRSRKLNATLAKDRVYALLGLVSTDEVNLLRADYSRSDTQVYGDAMRTAIWSSGNFDILRLTTRWRAPDQYNTLKGAGEHLPSWMIDLGSTDLESNHTVRHRRRMEMFVRSEPTKLFTRRKSAATTGDTTGIVSFSSDMKFLTCRGGAVGHVAGVFQFDTDFCSALYNSHAKLEGFLEKLEGFLEKLPHRDPYCVLAKKHFFEPSVPLTKLDCPVELAVDWTDLKQTKGWLVMNRKGSKQPLALLGVRSLFRLWSRCVSAGRLLLGGSPRPAESEVLLAFEKYAKYIPSVANTLYLFITDCGFLGCADEGMREGDWITLLPNTDPVILRKSDDGKFIFRGMAYVHGIMGGELADFDSVDQEFVLK